MVSKAYRIFNKLQTSTKNNISGTGIKIFFCRKAFCCGVFVQWVDGVAWFTYICYTFAKAFRSIHHSKKVKLEKNIKSIEKIVSGHMCTYV